MNTERRHELEANSLARSLADWSDRLRPYTNSILVVIAALLLVYVGVSMWGSYQGTRSRAAWDDYQLAVMENDGEQRGLQRLASSEDHQGTEMQEWALLGWADRQLLRASQMYLTNRDEATKRLTNVIGMYEQEAANSTDPEIRNRARMGLARANEMRGNIEEARKQYAMVEGGLAPVATERMKELESKPVQETVKWLATAQLPKPATPGGPGTPGSRPGFESKLPETDAAKAGASATLKDILGGAGGPPDAKGANDPFGNESKDKSPETAKAAGGQSAAAPEKPADPAAAAGTTTPATPATAPAPSTSAPADKPAEAPASQPAAPAAK
jgi:hypothetical protein